MSKNTLTKDRTSVIFDNKMSKKTIKKAEKSKKKYIKKFGDDTQKDYQLYVENNKVLYDNLGIKNVRIADDTKATNQVESFDTEKGLIVGNIRMGFGHYRISMAIASAAHHLGYTPYWLDLNSFEQTTGGKVIQAQNRLYSMGSRISQKSRVFNKFVWEPLNYEGFRKISYNACDQKNAELMTAVFTNIPKDMPFVATHVWPAQAALHAGMKNVVNAIPDNWPMALHLAEGSVHTVQTHSSYIGYRLLNGMDGKNILKPMKKEDILYTGHYIDHEIVANIIKDCENRIQRREEDKPLRFLLTIGGAGAQREIFAAIINYLIPFIKEGKAALYINVGDYENVWKELADTNTSLKEMAEVYINEWDKASQFMYKAADDGIDVNGIKVFCHKDIYEAVYCTNILMRSCDVLVTKPSELAFYPVPKLFIKRVGGHEKWGAIHSAEIGDGTIECEDINHTINMLKYMLQDKSAVIDMCKNIMTNNEKGIYNGAYEAVKCAIELSKNK